MAVIHETVYPRFKNNFTKNELIKFYSPNDNELNKASKIKRKEARVCFLIMLKSFQRLGRAIPIAKVPKQIIKHISKELKIDVSDEFIQSYDSSGTRARHNNMIRLFLSIKPFNSKAKQTIANTLEIAAKTKDESFDLINIAIEELIKNRYELPAFATLDRLTNKIRVSVHRGFYLEVNNQLTSVEKEKLDKLLEYDKSNSFSMWDKLKRDPKSPTISNLRNLVNHLTWLKEQDFNFKALTNIPHMKIQNFAAEAKIMDISKIKEIEPYKRYTLILSLIFIQISTVLDDLAEMFTKRMMKIHRKGKLALEDYRKANTQTTDNLIEKLRDVLLAYNTEGNDKQKFSEIKSILDKNSDDLLEKCEAHVSNLENNYYTFLWKYYKNHRVILFKIIKEVQLKSTNQNTSLENDIRQISDLSYKKSDRLPTYSKETNDKIFDLTWIPNSWWKLVTGLSKRNQYPESIDRRSFEICIFTQIMWGLKSGDLFIPGSDKYSDYREQLISWEEYEEMKNNYGEQVNLSTENLNFTSDLKEWLTKEIKTTNNNFKKNEYVKIVNGEPVIGKHEKIQYSQYKKRIDELIEQRLKKVNIIDIITDTEYWVKWTKHFGLMSGHQTKLDDVTERYLLATFCYGCNLGPTQTIRSIEKLSRKNIAWINHNHVSEAAINKAITHLINAYNHFSLPKFWGTGQRASADGTKWDVYEQNLLSEYHIRSWCRSLRRQSGTHKMLLESYL